jgi:predicted nucleic acid-binding protein
LSEQELLVDACVLINLCASDEMDEIVRANGVELLATEEAAAESLYIERAGHQVRIDIELLVARGVLRVVAVDDDELFNMVEFATELDEGEAATLAVAVGRHLPIATDDRGALRFLIRRELDVEVRRTSDLLRTWASAKSTAAVEEVLRRIESDASFRPGPADPNKAWWDQHTAG